MAQEVGLRRSKSLKSLMAQKRSQNKEDEEPLPYRPVKHTFFQMHVTSDDVGLRPSAAHSNAYRTALQRNTWPIASGERRPGTYQFDTVPTLIQTPWELERSQRPSSQWSRSSKRSRASSRVAGLLPTEVLSCIFTHLRSSYIHDSTIAARALQHDHLALCLVNKHFSGVAREYLYREIWLPAYQDPSMKRYSLSRAARSKLKLVLRTLRESSSIAGTVRHVHITAGLASEIEKEISSRVDNQSRRAPSLYVFRDIILRCHNLEQCSGYTPVVTQATSDLLSALSSCDNLKSHIWRLPGADRSSGPPLTQSDFLESHINWRNLETLVIWHSSNGSGLGVGMISAMLQRLPALRHLALHGLPSADFHNGTLLMLPPLKSLRLEDLHGVTDQGIEHLAHARLAWSLERLTLCGQELTALQTFKVLFANLPRLDAFTLVQQTSPEPQLQQLFSSTATNFWLGCSSLRYLHWDVDVPGSSVVILANSIAAGKFPSLETVKVPCDEDGSIQGLCRPIVQRPVSATDLSELQAWEESSQYQRSLRVAQIQAQLRIREQRKQPSVNVVVQDENDQIQHRGNIGSYLGNTSSKIEYSLEPAIKGRESAIAHIDDVALPRRRFGRDTGKEDLLDVSVLF